MQRKCRELGIPVLIIVEGWSAAGKGSMINKIIQPLDPGFKVSCIASPNRDEQLRPFLWRFWRRTPSAEKMAIFDRSWYRNLLDEVVDEISMVLTYKKPMLISVLLNANCGIAVQLFLNFSSTFQRTSSKA